MIEIKNIYKTYATRSGNITALQDVSLTVEKGQIFGVIGKSGAGKSSLIRCVNLLERPNAGSVVIDQQNLLELNPSQLREVRHRIGMVFQHFNLLNSRTVYENIALPLELMHQDKRTIQASVLPLLALVGLQDRAQAYPSQLSGGQKQRVAIARALATKPKVLLCDEMTSALDPQTTQSILELVQDINAKIGLTILLITHEMEVIKRICDKVAVLDQGRIVEQGDVLQIFRLPQHEISRQLIQAAFHLDLPKVLQEKIVQKPSENCYTLLRISFIGESVSRPLMNHLIQNFNLEINMLQSNLEMLHTKPIGMMLVGARAEAMNIRDAIHYLQSQSLTVEVMGYVANDDWHFA